MKEILIQICSPLAWWLQTGLWISDNLPHPYNLLWTAWIVIPLFLFLYFVVRPFLGWWLSNLDFSTYETIPGSERTIEHNGHNIPVADLESGGMIFEIPERWAKTLPK